MAYAAVIDVQGRIARHVLTDQTPLTPDQVDEFIADVDAEINGVLVRLGYTVPVMSPVWFIARLRSLSSDGSAAIALKALFSDAVGPGAAPAYAFYERRYREGLKLLKEGTHPNASGVTTVATYFTERPSEDVNLFDVAKQY